jgi:deazaflavin-dependent oxidoreductase (nitroreductase family)
MPDSGIPAFHPESDGGFGTHLVQRALAAGRVRRVVTEMSKTFDPVLHWMTRGRFGDRLVMPFASMTTTGARSGQPRTTAVLYFSDGDDVIVIASNFGGEYHPAWYHNLKAHPETVLSRGEHRGTYNAVEVTDDAERERLFALVGHLYAGFSDYRERTARVGREIPIMRLRPTG